MEFLGETFFEEKGFPDLPCKSEPNTLPKTFLFWEKKKISG